MKRALILMILYFMLTACGAAPEVVPTETAAPTLAALAASPTLEPTQTPTPEPTSTPEPSPTPAPPPEIQYAISAELDFSARWVKASETITIPNLSDEPIASLTLVVQPRWYENAFELTSLTWDDGTPIEGYYFDEISLIIPLAEPLAPNDTRRLTMDFELFLPQIVQSEDYGPIPFGYTLRQINLVDWYPFVPAYKAGQGWIVHPTWYYGEHLVYPTANFDVALKVVNAPSVTMVAASAPDTGNETVHIYHLEDGRNFVASVSASYMLLEEQVGDVLAQAYIFPQHQTGGKAAFETMVKALELYTELYGAYPHSSMTLVEADFLHDMEYQSLIFISHAFFNTFDGTAETYLVTITAHETAHQWFYGLVGNDPFLEPWLDEAFCTYSERLFYEKLYPNSQDWWWYARVNYYVPSGWIDSDLAYNGGYRTYRDAIYLQGAKFLEDLRFLIGDEAFFAFVKDYVATYRDQIVTRQDFFTTLARHSDVDISALMTSYFQYP